MTAHKVPVQKIFEDNAYPRQSNLMLHLPLIRLYKPFTFVCHQRLTVCSNVDTLVAQHPASKNRSAPISLRGSYIDVLIADENLMSSILDTD